MINPALYSSKKDDWETPDEFFNGLNKVLGPFDVDLACNSVNMKCNTGIMDIANHVWEPEDKNLIGWLNPPYSAKAREIVLSKAMEFLQLGILRELVCLFPFRTDTKWFFEYVWQRSAWFYPVKGRLTFKGGDYCAPFPSCVVQYTSNMDLDWPPEYGGYFDSKGKYYA